MRISIQNLPDSQMEIKIEVPAEEFQGFYEKAVLNLGKDLAVEGFRKGHLSKEVVEQKIGPEKILKEAAEMAIKENYVKAIRENKIEPLGQPEIAILKMAEKNPLEFKAKVAVFPQVELPDYKKIAAEVEKKEPEVTAEEIAKLKAEKERREKERVRQEILEKIAARSKMEIPPVLLESEKKRMLENMKHLEIIF